MATSNVDFYARMQGHQKKLHESEQHRMELEHKFNAYLSSDKRLSRLKTAKLQRVWQKVCEDEKRSKIRNQQLLDDYRRVESHVSALSTRTERLRLLKDQYERQVELMYPKWKEQIEGRRLQQQIDQQRKQQQGGALYSQPVLNGTSYVPQHVQPPYPSLHNGATHMSAPLSQYGPPPSSVQFPTSQAQYKQSMTGLTAPYGSAQTGVYDGQRGPMNGTSQGPLSTYDTLNRSDLQNQPGYTQRQQDPNSGFETGYNRSPQVQIENGSYPVQMPQYGNDYPKQEFQQQSQPTYQPNKQQQHQSNQQQQNQPLNQAQHHHEQQLQQQPHLKQEQHYQQQHQLPNQDSHQQQHQLPTQDRHQQQQQLPNQDRHQQQHQLPNQDRHQQLQQPPSQERHQQQHPQSSPQQHQQARPDPVSQNLPQSQYRPKSDSVGETSSTISVSSDSHYSGSDIQPKIVITNQQQETKGLGKPPMNSKADVARNDTGTTEIVPNKNLIRGNTDQSDYLLPMMENGVKDSVATHSAEPVQRTRKQGNVKLPVSSRTEPFSSEGEQDEEEVEEEETEDDEDEDSAQLRSALEDALAKTTDIPVVRVEVTTHDNSDAQKAENGRHEENQVHKVPSSNLTKDDSEEEEDSDSEIGSDMSLPLSDTGGDSKDKMAGEVTWKPEQDTMGTTTSKNSENVLPNPAVTTKGFWLLKHAVEIEVEQSDNISGIYNSPNCTDAIKSEIIKSANQGSSLSHLDPNAISMVIIQTLPSIVESLPGGCLLSDKMLSSKRPINEVTVRSFIYSAALGFWDKLIRHLEFLVKKGVFEPDEVANKFAPLLTDPESTMADTAVSVLCKLLEDIQGDDSYLDESSSVALPTPSPSPRKLSDTREEGNQQHLLVPRLNLGDTDRSDRSEDAESDNDSFFDNKVPLTETNAYQKMLGNTYTSDTAKPSVRDDGDNADESDESESEDEIEKAARITPRSPSSGANKKKCNVLSSLGGSLGLTDRSDDNDEEEDEEDEEEEEEEEEEDDDNNKLKVTGGGESTQRSDQVSSTGEDSDDIASSPSPPGTGYIPSAMEHSMKSTARSDPLQRSAAFWGEESDMDESEMSIPMGTKSAEDDKDDFDFYD